jgi:hypothetical protein
MFVIEDKLHAEHLAEFTSMVHAMNELERLATIPWDQVPHVCPCRSWQTCGREYHVVEYDVAPTPWRRLSAVAVLEVSAKGAIWI